MNRPVFICEIRREWLTTQWLCQPHIDERSAERGPSGLPVWSITRGAEVDGDCALCELARQAAPDYVTPTVDYVLAEPRERVIVTPIQLPDPQPRMEDLALPGPVSVVELPEVWPRR